MNPMLACAAALAACPLTPAVAADSWAAPHAAVAYADLDLAKPAGVARLDRRIRTAVAAVCGTPVDYDPVGANAIRRCRAEAREAIAPHRARLVLAAQTEGALAAR